VEELEALALVGTGASRLKFDTFNTLVQPPFAYLSPRILLNIFSQVSAVEAELRNEFVALYPEDDRSANRLR
jgi:hypothetical protein